MSVSSIFRMLLSANSISCRRPSHSTCEANTVIRSMKVLISMKRFYPKELWRQLWLFQPCCKCKRGASPAWLFDHDDLCEECFQKRDCEICGKNPCACETCETCGVAPFWRCACRLTEEEIARIKDDPDEVFF